MTNHTDCLHPRTPAGRKSCRTRRTQALRDAQAAYGPTQMDDATTETWDVYEGLVITYSMLVGIDIRDAYNVVENGPCA
ncbi:MAG: hypothetical protein ABW022_11190 [Actinoplanes sp.]